MEERMTVCNMSIEAGARAGMVAPDDTTYQYMAGRPLAPQGAAWDAALERWRALPSDAGAKFDKRGRRSTSRKLEPMITFGTNPGMVMPIDDAVPDGRRSGVPQSARLHAGRGRQAAARASPSTSCSSARARTAA